MQIKKLVLQTAYLATLKEFYSSILQLPLQMKEKEMVARIGNTVLYFEETKSSEPFYHFAINIPSNKIDEAKTWLSSRAKLLWMEDYKNDVADFVNWRAKSVYFFDPAGNILELIARFDLDNATDEPFSSKQFLSISEAGLVFNTTDFEQKTEELKNKFSLSYFSKQPPLPQFRVIGDDEGLFVIVPQHRNWFPTDKPAEIFPMTVEFTEKDKNFSFTMQSL
jgi:hypothetical protein